MLTDKPFNNVPSDLTSLIDRWKSSGIELREAERLITLLIADNERLDPTPPERIEGATHWAILPDDSVLYYKVSDEVHLWLPLSHVWDLPNLVPYTLHCFDD